MPLAISMKGFRETVRRAVMLPVRYGPTTTALRRRLDGMRALCSRWELTPTIPVTVSLLERHGELVRSLDGVDVAIHGFQHLAYSELTAGEQASDLDKAHRVLTTFGLTARGFRAPYLRPNRNTLELLRSRGFLYDSSFPEFTLSERFPFVARLNKLVQARYGANLGSSVREHRRAGIVEFPVSLPDDELLIDALRIRNQGVLFRVYEAMLADAKARSSILVLQVHPERYHMLANALELVLERATDEGAWKASLTEAAEWVLGAGGSSRHWPENRPYALAVTGDLDAAALGDFAPRVGLG